MKNVHTNHVNKIFFIISLCSIVFLIFPFSSHAQVSTSNPTPSGSAGTTNRGGTFSLQNPLKVDSIGGLIGAFVEIVTYIVVIVAVLSLVYVGLRYILARGNPDEMKKMSAWLLYIVIGVAIVLGARIIVSIVINTLGATNTVNQGVIQSADRALNGR